VGTLSPLPAKSKTNIRKLKQPIKRKTHNTPTHKERDTKWNKKR